ncbi:MAG TPA: hypothetical protein VNH13_10485 [Candidatus Acidoferrales bacterium]|jgi:hypothetical protein|nr:hypothetical protein [Candidatus Acidoferrales bacterium]
MTYDERVVRRRTTDPTVYTDPATSEEVVDRTTVVSPSGGELGRRLVVLVFGIIQLLIAMRIVLLLLDAREGNDLVRFILDASQVFVAPFIGIFNTDALRTGGSVFDVAAVAALVGWTILEAIALWIVNLFRRETTAV